jgi:DNA-binding NarL/FixJ family response regulator
LKAIALVSASSRRRDQWRQAFGSVYVVHEVAGGGRLDQRIGKLRPSVVLLDDRLLGRPGVSTITQIRRRSPGTRILLVDADSNPRRAIEALRAGASGSCPADAPAALLRRAVRLLLQGEVWASRRVISSLVDDLANLTEARQLGLEESSGESLSRNPLPLSRREADVVRLVAAGRSNRTIASELGLAEKTVKSHLTSVFRKVGVTSRLQLAILARRSHLAG